MELDIADPLIGLHSNSYLTTLTVATGVVVVSSLLQDKNRVTMNEIVMSLFMI